MVGGPAERGNCADQLLVLRPVFGLPRFTCTVLGLSPTMKLSICVKKVSYVIWYPTRQTVLSLPKILFRRDDPRVGDQAIPNAGPKFLLFECTLFGIRNWLG